MSHLLRLLVVSLLASSSLVGVASAQLQPEFKLGFKALASHVPEVVGQPLENEHWGNQWRLPPTDQQRADGLA